jgi:hypothetical protein
MLAHIDFVSYYHKPIRATKTVFAEVLGNYNRTVLQ